MITENNPYLSRLIKTFYMVVNPLFRFLVVRFAYQSRREQDALHILRVQGWKSGKRYEIPVRVALFEHNRYIVSLLGDSQWSRNLRKLGMAHLIAGSMVEPIHACEVQGQEKVAFLTWYCQQPAYAARIQAGTNANTKQLTTQEIDRLSRLYPVFRLESATESEGR